MSDRDLPPGLLLEGTVILEPGMVVECPAALRGVAFTGRSSFGAFSYIGEGAKVRNAAIGRFCSIAERVIIGPSEPRIDWLTTAPEIAGKQDADAPHSKPGPVRIQNDVWIGDAAFIRAGVTIGDGAAIGARAVVTRDVEPYAVVAGNPAKVIRHRFAPDIVRRLLQLGWWNYDLRPHTSALKLSEPAACIETLARLIDAKELNRLQPPKYELVNMDGLAVWRPLSE